MTLPHGFTLVVLDEVDSTNDECRRRADLGLGDGIVVWAQSQTAGRGRRGREWSSPKGNLFVSLLIDPQRPMPEAAQLSFVAALALAECLIPLLPGCDIRCKWPNDVLVNGRKLSGMLLETVPPVGLILGLGVNIVSHPELALYPATSLAAEGTALSAGKMLEAFLGAFAPRLTAWRQEGFAAVRGDWLHHAKGLGEAIVVRLEQQTLEGIFEGLDLEGGLLLRQADGAVRRILAGDVFFPSPPS